MPVIRLPMNGTIMTIDTATLSRNTNSTNHQNVGCASRPLKSSRCLKLCLMAANIAPSPRFGRRLSRVSPLVDRGESAAGHRAGYGAFRAVRGHGADAEQPV